MKENKKINNKILLVGAIGVIMFAVCGMAFIPAWMNKININKVKIADNNLEGVEKIKKENKDAIINGQSFNNRAVKIASEVDYCWGALDAPVQLVIYNDFACPFSLEFYETTKEIKDYFNDEVAVIVRHFPLRTHPEAVQAALASECAGEQGEFWGMYNKLFEDNEDKKLNEEQYKKDAEDLSLGLAKFSECLETEKYKDKIEVQILEGRKSNITGTPGNFINGRPIPGAYPFEDFKGQDGSIRKGMKSIIEEELGR